MKQRSPSRIEWPFAGRRGLPRAAAKWSGDPPPPPQPHQQRDHAEQWQNHNAAFRAGAAAAKQYVSHRMHGERVSVHQTAGANKRRLPTIGQIVESPSR
jgi:formylglycine-generating enzyme required for sulfatase activity